MPERDMEGAEPPEYAEHLSLVFARDIPEWQAAGIHVDDWAWESHDFAESIVYGALVPAVPTEVPSEVGNCADADHVGERMMHLHLVAGQSYQDAAGPVVEERLAEAGTRLAMILNDAIGAAETTH